MRLSDQVLPHLSHYTREGRVPATHLDLVGSAFLQRHVRDLKSWTAFYWHNPNRPDDRSEEAHRENCRNTLGLVIPLWMWVFARAVLDVSKTPDDMLPIWRALNDPRYGEMRRETLMSVWRLSGGKHGEGTPGMVRVWLGAVEGMLRGDDAVAL